MFAVAMQKPGNTRETPLPVAGLGLIRVCVGNRDGTSHLVLQGIARVQLMETVSYKPYRVQRIRPLETPPCDNAIVDGLLIKVRELLAERIKLGVPIPGVSTGKTAEPPAAVSIKEVLGYLDKLTDPEQVADLVSCAVLSGPAERQAILETVNLESRLKRLIHFLMVEINRQKKDKNP
jgi:Lon protease-like protein